MLGWVSAEPRKLSTVQIQMRVTSTIAPGLVKMVEVQAPTEGSNGIMYTEDVNKVKITPKPFPLATAIPIQILGDTLRWNLDLSVPVPVGQYNLRFEALPVGHS